MVFKRILLGTALAVAAGGAAQASIVTPTGWYLSLAAGGNVVPDGKFDLKSTGGTSHGNASWDTGYAVSSAVGYDFGNHWRAEFEVTYRHNRLEKGCTTGGECGDPGFTAEQSLWELSQMVNILYDFQLGGNWSASVGAGIGGNLVVLKPDFAPEGDDYVFAGQVIAQVGYQFADRWQAYLDYHFMMMQDPSLDFGGGDRIEIAKQDHTFMLGIRFDLQSDHMAPPPPPPPPMAPAERPRDFIVFFGFNKANLTAEAARVVHEAAGAAREYGSATIIVVGHTDTSGSQSYNLRLSVRRANAVKAGLVNDGIKPGMIETSGKGETELMVQTGDGVKEPQNRRATVTLH
jgi:OOP family OmpA-OmpF porin